ncbi:tetratricopeptide repeat protein [Salinithrix halophila]|uniref:Tetratricopeptide repeat protein n=1 Tax=Salinithrix halophila TaxID=1485204 RepID=A0ABV8JHD0_9BACL
MAENKSIPLFDELGRLIWTDREEFRQRVIPENLQADWDYPENLYAFTVQLYRDGFLHEADQGADRLLELSGRAEEALLLKGLILKRQDKNTEAEAVLEECVRRYPERGVAYTYLARLYAGQSEEKAVTALQKGLEKEPNQATALRLLAHSAKDAEQAVELLKPYTELEESWWPQLELGRIYLAQGKVEEAMVEFRSSIEKTRAYRGEEGLPEWEEEVVAMTVSSLLRKYSFDEELIQFSQSYWTPQFLTPFSGLDYAQVLDEKGQERKAVEVVEEMLPFCEANYQPMLQLKIHQLEGKVGSRV